METFWEKCFRTTCLAYQLRNSAERQHVTEWLEQAQVRELLPWKSFSTDALQAIVRATGTRHRLGQKAHELTTVKPYLANPAAFDARDSTQALHNLLSIRQDLSRNRCARIEMQNVYVQRLADYISRYYEVSEGSANLSAILAVNNAYAEAAFGNQGAIENFMLRNIPRYLELPGPSDRHWLLRRGEKRFFNLVDNSTLNSAERKLLFQTVYAEMVPDDSGPTNRHSSSQIIVLLRDAWKKLFGSK